ncbi:MAG: CocE/NonD family hydrolase, partial [Mycobacteriales bacterium]
MSRLSRRTALPLALLTAAPALAALPVHAATPAYTVKALKITTTVASEDVTGAPATCVVDADLYTPAGVDRAHPAPAILTTNGFGGSKADQAGLGAAYASRGYVVLSYSGLGFGSDATVPGSGSGCKITLDDREHDGAAGSQLIDFLGGLKAADDGTKVDYVTKDAVAHDGKRHAGDVRVGMVGGSYGGQIQFAVAGVDPRLDTIVPLITWNDLSYSLAPNN